MARLCHVSAHRAGITATLPPRSKTWRTSVPHPPRMRLPVLLLAALLAAAPSLATPPTTGGAQEPAPSARRWFKGNTHTPTLNSDGDSPPDVVVRWYRENGYQFVVITDHEYLTDVAPLNALLGATGR